MNKILVVLGATSSLAQNKILPYLDNVHADVVLYSRRPIPSKYVTIVGDLDNFDSLSKYIDSKKTNDIYFYFALPPDLFESTINTIQIYFPGKNVHFALEKPFGTSQSEAIKLSKVIRNLGTEKFYLIDHYLAKESLIKFLDIPVETRREILSLNTIRSIQVSLLEKENISGRAVFYDKIGAIKDTGQNHLLNMLSAFINNDDRLKVLKKLTYVQNSLVTKQYAGYINTEGVDPYSKTETYFKAKFRYRNILVTLETGKSLTKTETFIRVNYWDKKPFELRIKPNTNETKTAHEYVIEDFLNGKNKFCLTVDEALESWKIVDQMKCIPNQASKTPLFSTI